jgi:hypothetical protein
LSWLCNLVSALKKNFDAGDIFENAPVCGDWLNNALDMQIQRSSNMVENGYAALASYKTALPRHAFNLFVNYLLKAEGVNSLQELNHRFPHF